MVRFGASAQAPVGGIRWWYWCMRHGWRPCTKNSRRIFPIAVRIHASSRLRGHLRAWGREASLGSPRGGMRHRKCSESDPIGHGGGLRHGPRPVPGTRRRSFGGDSGDHESKVCTLLNDVDRGSHVELLVGGGVGHGRFARRGFMRRVAEAGHESDGFLVDSRDFLAKPVEGWTSGEKSATLRPPVRVPFRTIA
ncbi:MAG: hypothetical protein RLZZ461_268 [Planctomycetota bacterium]